MSDPTTINTITDSPQSDKNLVAAAEVLAETIDRKLFKGVTSSHFFQTLKLTPVELPELETDDGSVAIVFVKPMSGKHGLKMGHAQLKAGEDATEEQKEEATDRQLAGVVGRSVFREDGERIFTDEEADRIDELLSARVFMRLAEAIGAINKKQEGGKGTVGESREKKD